MSRSFHDELKSSNVRTYCISPGSIQTEMGRRVQGQTFETFLEPDDIASYVGFIVGFDGNLISEEVRLNRIVVR